jgi:hypothetical protein
MAQQTQSSKKASASKQTAAEKAAAKATVATHEEEQGAAAEERHSMIAETAYLIAEQRGFQGDLSLQDWLQAEAEVDARFAARH